MARLSLPSRIALGLVASGLWALGTVLVRRMPGVPPLKMQALTSLVAAPVLLAASFAFERDVVGKAMAASWVVWTTIVWAGLASTVGASALLFWLVPRRGAGRVAPRVLAAPLGLRGIGTGPEGGPLAPSQVVGRRAVGHAMLQDVSSDHLIAQPRDHGSLPRRQHRHRAPLRARRGRRRARGAAPAGAAPRERGAAPGRARAFGGDLHSNVEGSAPRRRLAAPDRQIAR